MLKGKNVLVLEEKGEGDIFRYYFLNNKSFLLRRIKKVLKFLK